MAINIPIISEFDGKGIKRRSPSLSNLRPQVKKPSLLSRRLPSLQLPRSQVWLLPWVTLLKPQWQTRKNRPR
jgi:hypothetical protein